MSDPRSFLSLSLSLRHSNVARSTQKHLLRPFQEASSQSERAIAQQPLLDRRSRACVTTRRGFLLRCSVLIGASCPAARSFSQFAKGGVKHGRGERRKMQQATNALPRTPIHPTHPRRCNGGESSSEPCVRSFLATSDPNRCFTRNGRVRVQFCTAIRGHC